MSVTSTPRVHSEVRRMLAGLLVIHMIIAVVSAVGSAEPAPDFDRYYEIATGRGRPYVDYQVEHPPGTLILFKSLAAATGDRDRFALALVGVNVVAEAVILIVLLTGWGTVTATAFAALAVPLIGLLQNRVDLMSIAFATIAVAAWRRESPFVTAVSVVVGAAFKLWPLLFAALLLVPRRGRVAIAPLAVCAAAGATLLAGWGALAGTHGLYEVLTFRGAQGWQIESTVGAVLHLLHPSSLRLESGSWRIGSIVGPTSILMFVAAAPLSGWCVWQGGRVGRLGAGWLAGVSWLLLLSPLLSAQFAGWLVPGGAIAWTEGDRRLAVWTGIVVVLTEVFWRWYWAVIQSIPFMLTIVVVRNVALGALAVGASVALWTGSALDPDLETDLPAVAVVEGSEERRREVRLDL